jgi:hypothetical protein
MTDERPRPTKEEIIEKKINLAQQPGARVIQINSPGGGTITNILRQFDRAYDTLKSRLGEPGEKGVSFEVGVPLVEEAVGMIVKFSELTAKISDKISFKYYVPDEIKDLVEAQKQQPNV